MNLGKIEIVVETRQCHVSTGVFMNEKILLVTIDFPPLVGGTANYYFNLVDKMSAEKVVVLRHANSDANECEFHANFKIYTRNFFTKLIWPHWVPLIFQIYKIVKKESIKKIWVGQVLPVGTAVWILTKLLNHGILRFAQDDYRLSYFVTCHGNDLLRAKSHPRKYKLAKKILQNAERVEANTNFTQQILVKDFQISESKIKIVYPKNSLSKDQVNKEKVEELKNQFGLEGKKVLLTVARLVKSKGIDQVIKALPEIPNLVYLIVGDGDDKDRLTQIINKLPQIHRSKIIFTGNVPLPELPNYYALADVFILTPRKFSTLKKGGIKGESVDTESFGVVYLEAQEFNLPIIAGDVGGVREINYNKINFVDSENVEEIRQEISKIL